jgi:tetratricopeptide (TPR) repeat protein
MKEPGMFGLLALAFAQTGQGQIPQATETYQTLGKIDAQGRSLMASGLGDLAVYEGRFSEAERVLTAGAAADLAARDPDRAAAKYAALGYAFIQQGKKSAAMSAAADALKNGPAVKTRFLAARTFVEAGDVKQAQALAAELAKELQAAPQAYAKIIDGLISMRQEDPRQAIKSFTEANTLLDTWIGHFDLGRAYLQAGAPLQADSEFDRCLKRRGETLSLFLDEEPTFAYFPHVYYYQGRVREALKADGFANSYRAYLAIRGSSKEDPLLPDVRRRAG